MLGRLYSDFGDENYRRALVIAFFLSLFFSFVSFFLPVYLSSLGLSGYEIGVLVSLYAAAAIFVTLPTGIVNDKWTIRLTLITGILMISVFFFGLSLLDSFWIFLPLFLVGGLGNNLCDISLRTLVFKTRMEGKEGRKFGAFSVARFTASSIGLFLGGALVFLVGFQFGLQIIGIISLLALPLVRFKSTERVTVRLAEYKKDVLNRRVLVLGIIMFMFSLHWGSERTAFGLFLRNNLGLDLLWMGIYTSLSIPFLGLAAYYFGRRIDEGKGNLKMIYFTGMVLSGFSYIMNTIPLFWVSFPFRMVHEFGDGMAEIATYFWISRLFTTQRIGGGSGFMITVMLLGQITGSLVFGPIGQLYGYHLPLIITGITSITSAVLMLAFTRIFSISEK